MSSLDYNHESGPIMSSDIVDNDVHVKLQELTNKLIYVEKEKESMEREKQELHDSYNKQRAMCQKLLLQKEEEAERLKKELKFAQNKLANVAEADTSKIKAQEEQITELSQIVQVTLDESQNETKNLQTKIQSLEEQLGKLMSEKSESILLAPGNMISATKQFAKKVVSQLGSEQDRNEPEDLEDSMRKNELEASSIELNKFLEMRQTPVAQDQNKLSMLAKEDADKLRSVVVPLEKEIDELKEKLRISEERLRRYEKGSCSEAQDSVDATSQEAWQVQSSSNSNNKCEMCHNYETQLQAHQQHTKQLQREKNVVETNMEKFKEDLAKETQFRKEMEEKWNEKKEEQRLQVSQLKSDIVAGKAEMEDIQRAFDALRIDVRDNVKKLSYDRREINSEIYKIRMENDRLVGLHSKHSSEVDLEKIDYPNTVEDCQVILLTLRDDLIAALVAKEVKEQEVDTLRCEVDLLQTQLAALDNSTEVDGLRGEIADLREELKNSKHDKDKYFNRCHEMAGRMKKPKEEIDALTSQLKAANDENRKNGETVQSLRSQILSLQEQLLENQETQKDFVKLSQSLQMELENIRAAEKEVRWQHLDDAADCQGCKQTFQSAKKKIHCPHCGKIFCATCLDHVVRTGPNQRESRVCQVCHTLLNKESAPFFSQKPPQSPD